MILKANSILRKKDIVFKKPGTGIRTQLIYKTNRKKIQIKKLKKNNLLKMKDFYEN